MESSHIWSGARSECRQSGDIVRWSDLSVDLTLAGGILAYMVFNISESALDLTQVRANDAAGNYEKDGWSEEILSICEYATLQNCTLAMPSEGVWKQLPKDASLR